MQKVPALPGAEEGWPSFRWRRAEPGQLETLQQVQGKDPMVLFGLAHRVGFAGEA